MEDNILEVVKPELEYIGPLVTTMPVNLLMLEGRTPYQQCITLIDVLSGDYKTLRGDTDEIGIAKIRNTATYQLPLLAGYERALFDAHARVKHVGIESIYRLQAEDTACSPEIDAAREAMRAIKNNADYLSACGLLFKAYQRLTEQEKLALMAYGELWGVSVDDVNRALQAGAPARIPIVFRLDELAVTKLRRPETLPVLGSYEQSMFFRGGAHLLVSAPGIGKTRFSLQCVMDWGATVHYLSEDNESLWQHYTWTLQDSGLVIPPNFIVHCDARPFEVLTDVPDSSVLVIDTVRAHFGITDEFASTQFEALVRPIVDDCRRRNITLLLIHHARKSGGGTASDASSGSNALPGMVDVAMQLTQGKGGLLLHSTKNRYGPPAKIGLKWQDNRLVTTSVSEVTKEDDSDDGPSFDDIVLAEMTPGKLTKTADIVKACGCTKDKALRTLKQLETDGHIKHEGPTNSPRSGWMLVCEQQIELSELPDI